MVYLCTVLTWRTIQNECSGMLEVVSFARSRIFLCRERWQLQPGIYPLVMTNSLLLKMAIEIVSFAINSMVDLSIVMLNYQRVHGSHFCDSNHPSNRSCVKCLQKASLHLLVDHNVFKQPLAANYPSSATVLCLYKQNPF